MKTLYKFWSATALILALVACQDEEIGTELSTNTPGSHTLHCIMGNYTPQNRAQVELGYTNPTEEVFMWNNGDAFTAYDCTNLSPNTALASYVFNIKNYENEVPNVEADFECMEVLPNGHNITAIYPAQNTTATNGTIQLTIPADNNAMGSNTEEEIRTYMSSHMFMYATTQVNPEKTNMTFNHLCTMIRISYTNATVDEQTISALQIRGDKEYFGEKMDFNLQDQSINITQTTAEKSLTFDNLIVASGRTIDFYLLAFSGKEFTDNEKLYVTMTIGTKEQSLEMPVSAFNGKKFEAGMRYWLNVMQTKEKLIWKKDVDQGVISNIQLIKAVEESNKIQFDKDPNGFVDIAKNAEKIMSIKDFQYRDASMTSVEGIEHFTNLEILGLDRNSLKYLDLSKNTELKELYCSNNSLILLNISKNTKLKFLDCGDNKLTNLDISNNQELDCFSCGLNRLTQLDVSQNKKLTKLNCRENKLSDLVVAQNKELVFIDCSRNNLLALDVTQNEKLEELSLGYNPIASLDLSKNKSLIKLHCTASFENGGWGGEQSSNLLTTIDLSNNTELKELVIANSKLLTSLDISNNLQLTKLDIKNTPLTFLDLEKHTALEDLTLGFNDGLTSLNLSNNKALQRLDCTNSELTSLDLGENTELKELYCSKSPLVSLNINQQSQLRRLECYDCHISTLDISHNPQLEYLKVGFQHNENGSETELALTLTAEQNETFSSMFTEWGNEHLKLVIKQ